MSTSAGDLRYRPLESADIDRCLQLWKDTPGVGLSGADEPRALARFLKMNEGLCWGAFSGERPAGTILCGSDGRRGYLYHVAVDLPLQSRGIGRELVDRALRALRERGIAKCHAMVFANNGAGRGFWSRVGWRFRDELVLFSRDL